MYVNLEDQIVDITTMTKGFLTNALSRYEALCRDGQDHLPIYKENVETRDAIKAELKARHRLRFKCLIEL